MMAVQAVPLSRGVQLVPFLEFLDRIGARTEAALERYKLPLELPESSDTFIATRAMAAFIEDTARRQGIDDFGWHATLSPLAPIPAMARCIRYSPTLFHALTSVAALGKAESSRLEIWIEEREDWIDFCYRGSVEVGAPGAHDLALMQARIVLSLVRLFVEPDWVPADCALALRSEPAPIVREEFENANVRLVPDYSWHRLPRSILCCPLRHLSPATTPSSVGGLPEPAQGLVDSLTQWLRSCLAQRPTIRDAAEQTGSTVRSLQRELARAGCCYRDVLLRVKLDIARELLKGQGVKIAAVACETGFSDQAHFTRFFRNLTGMTPGDFQVISSGE